MDPAIARLVGPNRDKTTDSSNKSFTHVSLIEPRGKYKFNRNTFNNFWDVYCQIRHENPQMISGLAEVPSSCYPLLNDTDIKITYDPEKHHNLPKNLYNSKHLTEVIYAYQLVIKQCLQNPEEKHYIALVLEKSSCRVIDGQIKDGFHIHFPFCQFTANDHINHFLPKVKELIHAKNTFRDIGVANSADCIDDINGKPWLLYGSRKSENHEPYTLTKIFGPLNPQTDRLVQYDIKHLKLVLQKYNFNFSDLDNEPIDTSQKEFSYFLPRILSISPIQNHIPIAKFKNELNYLLRHNMLKADDVERPNCETSVNDDIKEAENIIELLSKSRASNHDDWMDIGWTLYSIGEGCQEALNLWINFSRQTTRNNFDESECIARWNKMHKGNKTMGTLVYYAKMDNLRGYNEYKKTKASSTLKQCVEGSHYDCALWLFERNKDEFVNVDGSLNGWFRLVGGLWEPDVQGFGLRDQISTKFYTELLEYKQVLYDQMRNERGFSQARMYQIKKLESNLIKSKDNGWKTQVLKECASMFFDSLFLSKLDGDNHLLAFTNGVLDLNDMAFRKARNTDYISKTTGYDYVELSDDHPDVIAVYAILRKTFVDPEIFTYAIEYAATLLQGGNFNKTLICLTGTGDNGKSVFIIFIQQAFGAEFSVTLPTSVLTGKRTQSSQATPELYSLKGSRIAIVQEPAGGDRMNTGVVKELTGNDKIPARGLYTKSIEIEPTWKITLICNKLPKLSADDPAVWNRIRVLPFDSKFLRDHEVPESEHEQWEKKIFRRNPDIEKLIRHRYKQAFMWILKKTYTQIRTMGMSPTPYQVYNATSKYKNANDFVLQFIQDRTVEDVKGKIMLTEIFNEYNSWIKTSHAGSQNIFTKVELLEEISKKLGPQNGYCWRGHRLKVASDDANREKEYDAIYDAQQAKLDNENYENSQTSEEKLDHLEEEKNDESCSMQLTNLSNSTKSPSISGKSKQPIITTTKESFIVQCGLPAIESLRI